ncbi:hypothetical protein KJ742_05235 [Patescibacteria group bacterium]|nr:hypothetical protein [Patescibacteria group bacterium]MBU1683321.1 hypothetical protein [Patescibacteria group bacterium]
MGIVEKFKEGYQLTDDEQGCRDFNRAWDRDFGDFGDKRRSAMRGTRGKAMRVLNGVQNAVPFLERTREHTDRFGAGFKLTDEEYDRVQANKRNNIILEQRIDGNWSVGSRRHIPVMEGTRSRITRIADGFGAMLNPDTIDNNIVSDDR